MMESGPDVSLNRVKPWKSWKKKISPALQNQIDQPVDIVHDMIKSLLERLLISDKPIDRTKYSDFIKTKTVEYAANKVFREVYYKDMEKVTDANLFPQIEKGIFNFLIQTDINVGWSR